jgi:hypothetical protein
MSEVREYAEGTSVTVQMPWSVFVSARLMCSDGVVRSTARLSQTADTFFSVPCAVKVKGRTVSGYMTFTETYGEAGAVPVAQFRQYTYGRNHAALPAWLSTV